MLRISQQFGCGVKHFTRPSQRATHTRCASFAPRRLSTWRRQNLFRKAAPNPQGHKAKVPSVVYRPILPSIVIGSEGRMVLDHCLGTHSTAHCSQVRCYPSGPARRHNNREYTHSITTTRTWVNKDIRQIHRSFPRWVLRQNVVRI